MTRQANWSAIGALAAVISALGTVIVLPIALLQLRQAREEFVALTKRSSREILSAQYARFSSPQMLYMRAEAAKSYPSGSPHVLEIFNFFDELGLTYKAGIISSQDIHSYFRDPILLYWCGWQQWLHEIRISEGEDPNTGDLHSEFQLLFEALKREKNQQCLSRADITNYLAQEVARYEDTSPPAPSPSAPSPSSPRE